MILTLLSDPETSHITSALRVSVEIECGLFTACHVIPPRGISVLVYLMFPRQLYRFPPPTPHIPGTIIIITAANST